MSDELRFIPYVFRGLVAAMNCAALIIVVIALVNGNGWLPASPARPITPDTVLLLVGFVGVNAAASVQAFRDYLRRTS